MGNNIRMNADSQIITCVEMVVVFLLCYAAYGKAQTLKHVKKIVTQPTVNNNNKTTTTSNN